MNLADYLSELLGQHTEVSMPGLGYFTRERISGYYNKADGKFYPPTNKVKYVPELKNDDVLAQYLADKKSIPLATAKYFTEKFVSNLKEQAAKGAYTFSDLGWFRTANDQLIFEPGSKLINDFTFYGYAPLSLKKLSEQNPVTETTPVFEDTAPSPVAFTEQAAVEVEVEQPVTDKPKKNWLTSAWFISLIAIVIISLAVWQYFIFNPSAFDKIFGGSAATIPVTQKPKTDTINKASTLTDSAAKAATPVIKVIDTANSIHYEVIAEAVKKMQTANIEIERLKSIGVEAKIVSEASGRFLKLSVGTFFTSAKADSARLALIKLHKITKAAYTIPILPKKSTDQK